MGERARDIVIRHRDAAKRERLFHLATKNRKQNVEACVAALKVAWADAILREIDGGGQT